MRISKIFKSRKTWKEKALKRGKKIRNLHKVSKRSKRQSAGYADGATAIAEISRLTAECARLRALVDQFNRKGVLCNSQIPQYRTLCVLIVICGIVSFRAVPRIMEIFQPLLRFKTSIPHFTSVINWTVRAGIAIYQRVAKLNIPWVALIDCSIDIGTRKALVILRVPLDVLSRKQGALELKDCECIGLKVSSSWNGQSVSEALTDVFEIAGAPTGILKDGGGDLRKGVTLFCERNPDRKIYSIEDLGHVTANSLKKQFAKTKAFTNFLRIVTKGAARIRQTTLAWALPPKIRTKGRFQGITEIAAWANKMLERLAGKVETPCPADVTKLRKAFSGLASLRPLLTRFCRICATAELFLQLMKTQGLNEATYQSAKAILAKLPAKSAPRIRLSAWLDKHIHIYREIGDSALALPVSTDAIESLFGKFKTIIQRNPQAEINRLIFVISLLCGNHSAADIDQALLLCSHSQMLDTVEETLSPTLRQARNQYLNSLSDPVPKSGDFSPQNTG